MAGTAENSKREGFVKEIEAQILSGKLKPGERLEAERELALRFVPEAVKRQIKAVKEAFDPEGVFK